MTPVLVLLSPVLAQQQPPPNAPEFGGSSPIGLVVILLLFIAMFFLIRSMNTHLRKVPATFDKPQDAEKVDEPGEAGAERAGSTEPEAGGEGRDSRT